MTNRRSGNAGISKLVIGLSLGASLVGVRPAAAQSTIFNIPSTDTVAPKKAYFEIDYFPQLPKPEAGQFQTFAPRGVFGVTPQLEVGVNIPVTHVADDGGNFAFFSPNAKYKFYADDSKGLAATAGFVGYIAINNRDFSDDFGQVYANVSKKLASGTRLTGGAWGSLSYIGRDGGNTGGGLFGLEQPITGKVSFVADWFTGKNFWGYFTPGISIVLPPSGLLNIGYSIGNDSFEEGSEDYRNRALFVYYGITFP